MEKIIGIYCFENLIDGKKYVGQSDSIFRRLQRHNQFLKRNADQCVVLQNAWNQYGKENFKTYIIEECAIELLDEREQFWIKELHSHVSENGYNVSWGGDSFMRGRHHTEESKRMISEHSGTPTGEANHMFGVIRSEDVRNRISQTLKEYYENHVHHSLGTHQTKEQIEHRASINRGRKMTDEQKQRMSDAKKGKKMSDTSKANMSKARKGIRLSEEHKKNIGLGNKGKNTWSKGSHQSKETIAKRVESLAGSKNIKNSSSKYVGVSFDKNSKKWCSYINFKNKRFRLGYFDSEIDAALAYNKKAIELYGEDAKLNIID